MRSHKFSPSTLVRIILVSACIGTAILLLITLIDGPPKHRNEAVFQQLSEWIKSGYFSTNDMRNYGIGIVVFSFIPLIMQRIYTRIFVGAHLPAQSGHNAPLQRFLQSLWLRYVLGMCAVLTVVGIVWIVASKWELLQHLLSTKGRGRQLIASMRMLPFIGLVWGSVYGALRTKIWLRFTVFLWHMFRASGMSAYSVRVSIPGLFRDGIVVAIICILVWNPRFAYTYERLGTYGGEGNHQFHHVISFLGPINEAMHGTGFLVRSGAQYGILMTLIPATLFTFTGLSFSVFAAYAGVILVAYEILWYVLLLRLTGNRLLALFGTILSIRLTHYRWFWPHEATIYPSTTPFRFGWDVVVWLAILAVAARPSWHRVGILAAVGATAVWYNVEIGGALALAAAIAFVWERAWRTGMHWLGIFTGVFAGWGMIISLLILFRAGVLPQWGSVLAAVGLFGGGFLDYPMPIIGEYYVVLSIYFVTYCWITVIARSEERTTKQSRWSVIKRTGSPRSFLACDDETPLLIAKFTLVYGLLTFVYYLGSNEPHHFFAVLHPALFLCILALSHWRSIGAWMGRVGAVERSLVATYVLVVGALFLWEPQEYIVDVVRRMNSRYGPVPRVYSYWNDPGAGIFVSDHDGADVRSAVAAIKKYSGDSSGVLVLSRYDTLLYVMSGKTSRTDMSWLEYEAVLKRQQQQVIALIQQNPPEYAFVYALGYDRMSTDTISMAWEAVKDRYGFIEHAGMVDVYRRVR